MVLCSWCANCEALPVRTRSPHSCCLQVAPGQAASAAATGAARSSAGVRGCVRGGVAMHRSPSLAFAILSEEDEAKRNDQIKRASFELKAHRSPRGGLEGAQEGGASPLPEQPAGAAAAPSGAAEQQQQQHPEQSEQHSGGLVLTPQDVLQELLGDLFICPERLQMGAGTLRAALTRRPAHPCVVAGWAAASLACSTGRSSTRRRPHPRRRAAAKPRSPPAAPRRRAARAGRLCRSAVGDAHSAAPGELCRACGGQAAAPRGAQQP